MIRRLLFLSTALALAFALGASSASAATDPPCTPEQYPAQEAQDDARRAFTDALDNRSTVPAFVPFGQATPVEVYLGLDDDDATGEDAPVVTIESVSGAPLAHPYQRAFDVQWDGTGAFPHIPVLLEQADGPAVIVIDFRHWAGSRPGVAAVYCRATVRSAPITPVPSRVTMPNRPARVARDYRKRHQGIAVRLHLSLCASDKRLRIEARAASRMIRLVARDCRFRGSRQRSGLRVRGNGRSVRIFLERRSTFTQTVRYRLTYGGKLVRAGSFRVRGLYHEGRKGYRIYDSNFDDFVNVCINQNYTTYASGGRLYCSIPGDPAFYYQRVDRIR